MTVKKVYTNGKVTDVGGTGYEPDGAIEGKVNPTLFEIGALCNDAELEESSWNVIGDPTEGCLLTSARKAGLNENELREQYPRQGIVPFNSKRKRMSTVHDIDGEHVMYTKGAPDLLLEHCNRIWLNGEEHDLTAENKQDILDTNKEFAQDALRVLGFAYKRVEAKDEYTNDDEDDLVFVGLQGMIDPPREEVKEAIQKCKNAGIDVIMVTGDHKDTAVAIGRELGLEGSALMGDEAFQDDASIYARVSPERKKKLVEELQDRHEIVAMTGDGVNDAPALKKADIGIAMGIKGTDVAKEASEMVLTDDNFSSIVDAVEEGRGIFDNIKKFVNYLLSSNFGEVLVLFLAMIIGFTGPNGEVVVPLATLQLLWMNIVTDSLPAFALGVDPPEHDIMDRAPRDPDEGIITQNMALNILLIGFMICAATLYLFNRDLYLGKAHAQTVALTTLVMMEIVRLQMIRQGYHIKIGENPFLIWSVVGVLALQMLAMYTPLSEVLGLVALGWVDWAFIAVVCAGMFAVGIVASHFIKMVTHQRD
jgi:Ca2+-transporting ATPase